MNRQLISTRLFPALVLAFGLAAGASAAPGDASPATPAAPMQGPGAGAPMPGYGMQGMHGMHGGERGMRAFGRLHDELKLDAKQEAAWSEAAKATREQHAAMRERFRSQHDEMIAALNQPGADLRALAKRSDDLRAEQQKMHEATRDRWLAVYDTLNPEQKEKARLFVKSMFERRDGGRRGRKPA
jgi:Spy/CpxP family protein refolding chaperone